MLLDAHQLVRSAGIDLWAACAAVADSLPAELAELSVPLRDPYVIVHRKMLDRLPRLSLPAELAPTLLPVVFGWVTTYADKPDPDILDLTIWALRDLAQELDDPATTSGWFSIALAYRANPRPHDRQRLLKAWWPDELRIHPAWVTTALATAAAPELADYYNQRHEPLLQELMDRPDLLTGVPFSEIEPLSTVHGPAHTWRALEPVELLQSAGRSANAVTVARGVESSQPPGEEGAPGRRLAGLIARGAELAQTLAERQPAAADLIALADAVTSAVADLEASFSDGVPDGQLRATLNGLLALAADQDGAARRRLCRPAASAADELDRAARLLLGTPSAHAPGAQRTWVARAWQIAALLLSYDAAVRAVSSEASGLLQAARRQAQVLRAELSTAEGGTVPAGLGAFLAEVEEVVADPASAQAAWQRLTRTPPPVSLVGTSLLPELFSPLRPEPVPDEPPRAVCVATLRGVPVTDVLVVGPGSCITSG